MGAHLQVSKIVFGVLIYNHFVSCLWLFIGRRVQSDTGEGWLDYLVEGEPLSEQSFKYQYVTSFHWTVGHAMRPVYSITAIRDNLAVLFACSQKTVASVNSVSRVRHGMITLGQGNRAKQVVAEELIGWEHQSLKDIGSDDTWANRHCCKQHCGAGARTHREFMSHPTSNHIYETRRILLCKMTLERASYP
eukprot:5245475-Amphidinium_carterae.1